MAVLVVRERSYEILLLVAIDHGDHNELLDEEEFKRYKLRKQVEDHNCTGHRLLTGPERRIPASR